MKTISAVLEQLQVNGRTDSQIWRSRQFTPLQYLFANQSRNAQKSFL